MAVLNFTKLVDTGLYKSQLDASQGFGSYQVAVELSGANAVEVQYQLYGPGGSWSGFPRSQTAYTMRFELYMPNRGDLDGNSGSNGAGLSSTGLPTLLSNRVYIATTVEIYNWSDILYSIATTTGTNETNYRVFVQNFNWKIYRV